MSIDRSLKRGSRLSRSRNVMTRAERIEKMIERGTFDLEGDKSPFGLPKTRVVKSASGKKKKKKKKEEDE